MRRLAAIPLTLLLSCGTISYVDQLNPAIAGTWSGPSSVRIAGGAPSAGTLRVTVTVSNDMMTVVPLCADGSGAMPATGNVNLATWGGTLTCPPAPVGGCASTTLSYQSATFTLGNDDVLTVSAQGDATGCGATGALVVDAALHRS